MSLCCECGCNIRKDLISINLHKAKSIFAMQSISANQVSEKKWLPLCPTTWATWCKDNLHGIRRELTALSWLRTYRHEPWQASSHRFYIYLCVCMYIYNYTYYIIYTHMYNILHITLYAYNVIQYYMHNLYIELYYAYMCVM